MWLVLALKAVLIALIPLTLVFLARGTDRYRKLAWVMVFFTFDLIVFGAFTRLTDSGLGCPDWPGCYGEGNPFLASHAIDAAEAALPTGPVTVFKAWIEMIHRYLAMAVGLMILVTCFWSYRLSRRSSEARYSMRLPLLLLLFVCVQGAFGAWTVTLKLQPIIVTLHLLLGMSLLGVLTWHAMRQSDRPQIGLLPTKLKLLAVLALVVSFMQIGLGGWVSTNYAALACGSYPQCLGEWMPPMNFEQGFTLWRHLGMTSSGDYLPVTALVAVHWVHRVFALLVVGVVGLTGWQTRRVDGLQRLGWGLLALIVLQFCSGIATVVFNWPLLIAVLHNAGAALMLLYLVMLNYWLSKDTLRRFGLTPITSSPA